MSATEDADRALAAIRALSDAVAAHTELAKANASAKELAKAEAEVARLFLAAPPEAQEVAREAMSKPLAPKGSAERDYLDAVDQEHSAIVGERLTRRIYREAGA